VETSLIRVILQTPLNFKIFHFKTLNFELLLIKILPLILIVKIKKNKKKSKYPDFYFFKKIKYFESYNFIGKSGI
jgi:hypothetical protein